LTYTFSAFAIAK